MEERYYSVNGKTKSYDDLFKEHGMQTDFIIKSNNYQLTPPPPPLGFKTSKQKIKTESIDKYVAVDLSGDLEELEAPSWFDKAKNFVNQAIDARNQRQADLYKPKTL